MNKLQLPEGLFLWLMKHNGSIEILGEWEYKGKHQECRVRISTDSRFGPDGGHHFEFIVNDWDMENRARFNSRIMWGVHEVEKQLLAFVEDVNS